MKILIYASFLILYVNSSCSRRPQDKCLRDEQCQIVGTSCEKRPQSCEQIDASNPNNCSGFKCYYNKELQICQSYKKLLDQQFHKKDKQKKREQNISKSEQSKNYNQQQNSQSENSESLEYNQLDSNQNNQASGNSMNENSDKQDSNSVEIINTSTTQNSEVDYSKQDTIVFEIVDINFNQDELDNTEDLQDLQKDLVLVASSNMIITFVIIQLIF